MSAQPKELARQIPHSLEAEGSVLGAMMLDPRRVPLVLGIIQESDLFSRRHQMIFRAIVELDVRREAFDSVTLGDWFAARGLSDVSGGRSYLLELANTTPSASAADSYARIVRGHSLKRQSIEIADRLQANAWARDTDAVAVADEAIRDLMKLSHLTSANEMTLREACQQVLDDIAATQERAGALSGLTTGIIDLDDKLGGFHRGDLTIIPARPSMGKTSLLGFMVAAAARTGTPVGLFSAEQPGKQIAARLMSAAAKVVATRLRNCKFGDGEYTRLVHLSEQVKRLPVWIMDRSAPHIREVERVARRWKMEHDIQALYVDYTQRLQGDGRERAERVGDVARGLKGIARDLDIPVIALAQVKREVETRQDKRPAMGDISDSGDIEKEADTVACMYRDEYYNRNSSQAGTVELLIEKNRHGPTGMVRIGWDAKHMDFFDLAFGRELQSVAYYESRIEFNT